VTDELRNRLMASPSVKLATIGLGDLSKLGNEDREVLYELAALERRRSLAKRGLARPDGSFPIPSVPYLRFALEAYTFAEDRRAAKRWIVRRARALNRIHLLPETWRASETEGGSPSGRD
jgi:hypothetical protein